MTPTQEAERERDVRSQKPVLEALAGDVRRAIDALPSSGRREQLENILVSFNTSLSSPKCQDVTQAEADAFRAEWEIPISRNTKAPALL